MSSVTGFVVGSRVNVRRQALPASRLSSSSAATRAGRTTVHMAVAKKSSYNITVMPGDGIGPEICKASQGVLEEAGKKFGYTATFTEMPVGGAAIDLTGEPLPAKTLETCKNSDSVLLACIGGPKWDDLPRTKRPESGLLSLRKELGLFANLRPAKAIDILLDASPFKPEVIQGVDIMVVRELTGDVYFGEPKGIEVVDGERVGFNNMIYKEHEIERVARVAYTIAQKRGRRLCSVDKANVLDVSQLWRDVVTSMGSKDFPDVELSHLYVDNAVMQLVRWPKQFDTIVTGNIFGDIISDEASMLVGSLGMLPSASLGDASKPGMFEPVHGSAPDIAGQDKANPIALVLSAAMMMRYDLDRPEVADALEQAVQRTLDQGFRTGDIMSAGCTLVGCQEMGRKLASNL